MKIVSKRNLVVISIIGIILTGTIGYFKLPLKADQVIIQMENVDKIHFGLYKEESLMVYDVELDEPEEIKKILGNFNYSNYTRIPGYKNIANDGRFLSMVVFYGEDFKNQILEINDQGYLVVERNTYKLTENHSFIFDELYQLLVADHKPIH